MKKAFAFAFAVALILLAPSLFAATAWMDVERREVRWFRPPVCTVDGITYRPPSDDILARAFVVVDFEDTYGELRCRVISWDPPSVRAFTAEEKAAQEAADAAQAAAEAAAQAEAVAQAGLPQVFTNGIVSLNGVVYLPAVPGATNGWAFGISPAGDPLVSHWYGSPTSTVAEIQADFAAQAAIKEARRNNIRKAKGKGNSNQAILERLSALEANEGVE